MIPLVLGHRRASGRVGWLILLGTLAVLAGCNSLPKADAESNRQAGTPGQEALASEPASVNVSIAREGTVSETRAYTGTTQPIRLISLRSQVEGRLLELNVGVGDRVKQGQVLARVDDRVLITNVAEASAEIAARRSEVAQARAEVSDAQTQVGQAQAELQQAQSDSQRLQSLWEQGAIPEQQAEQARTRVRTSQQALRSTQEQVRTRQEAVVAAQERVAAQQAVIEREQERQSFTQLRSPVTGAVVEQPTEVGNLMQPGTEVLKLGDFSQVKVVVPISELELSNIRPAQSVQVRLDAFPDQRLTGRVLRISPAADPVARLVPIEVAIPNPTRRIGSGLLARVTLAQQTNRPRVLIPETALQANVDRRNRQPSGERTNPRSEDGQPQTNRQPRDAGTIFVIDSSGNESTVTLRQVTLGKRGDGQVEVISGLQTGEQYVANTSKPLKSGDTVRSSILSERSTAN
jgi:HlyD family secretion protein